MGIFTPRSLDIDVVMDLMVHELDIIASLVNSEVVKLEAVGIPILTPKIDLANARLEFANGCTANITASRVAANGCASCASFNRTNITRSITPTSRWRCASSCRRASRANCRRLSPSPLAITKREPLLAEIEAFVDTVQTGGVPVVSGADGRRALALAEDALTKIKLHAQRAGLALSFE
jgi:predicted dehydrogenase